MRSRLLRAFCLVCFWVTACTGGRSSAPARPELPYIKAIYSLPLTLDPVMMNDTASLAVSNLIYDGLLRFGPDLRFEGAIAESWTSDETGKRYEFRLRPGAKFHDGSPITPETVVKSLSRAVAPKSTVYKYYDCIRGAEEFHAGRASTVAGLRAEGTGKVVVELNYPFPPFLSILTGATAKILPLAADSDSRFFEHPIGSGPFRFVEMKKSGNDGGEISLRRFDGYHAGAAKIASMILRVLSENVAIEQAKAGAIHDLANFPFAGSEDLLKAGTDASTPVAATWIIGLNVRKAPFDNLQIRRAFKASIDADAFRRKFYPDAIPATGYIPKNLPGYADEAPRRLPPNKSITTLPISIAVPKLLSKEKEIREHFERELRKQGWNVKFVAMDWDRLIEGYDKKTLQGFLLSMNMDYPDTEFLIRSFESGNPDNFSGLSDREIDRMILQARNTKDRLARIEVYRVLTKHIEDAAVTVNLFYPRAHNWVHRCVRGFFPNVLADYYVDYRSVELDQKCLKNVGGER